VIRAPYDRLDPRALALRQVVQDVPRLVHLAPLNERGFAEDRACKTIKTRFIGRPSAGHALATPAILYAFTDPITGRLRIGMAYLR